MTNHPIYSPRKLIEVALPLDAINVACAREKSIRHGHPSTLHLWWARRPLAAARAVIFAQLVNDPGYQHGGGFKYGKNKKDAAIERKRLFKIIEDLVLWENTTNEEVLERARAEIRRSWREVCELNKDHPQAAELFNPDKLPALHDPFAGGGAIPLEAQRLGLEAYASDLNPVAVLINKAMIEIPPKFAGRPPVNPESRKQEIGNSHALQGTDRLAESDGSSEAGVSVGSEIAEGGDLRNAVAAHAGGGVGSSQHSGGLGTGVGEGKGPVSGDIPGVPRGDGDASNALRGDWMVSASRDAKPASSAQRGREDADRYASKPSRKKLTPTSSELFPRLWPGATGLAEDVRYYGAWMREQAQKRIGHLYPPVEITAEMAKERPDLKPLVGQKLTVIAWLWARTVKSPNPAFSHVDVPLAASFILSSKEGTETYIQPVVKGDSYQFTIKLGIPPLVANTGTKMARGANFSCIVSGAAIESKHIYTEALANRMSSRLMAVVVEGHHGRLFLEPKTEIEIVASRVAPTWKPDLLIPDNPRWFSPPLYGLKSYSDLFTSRQLVAFSTLCDLVGETRERIRQDAIAVDVPDEGVGLDSGGSDSCAYAEAVSVYLGMGVSRLTDIQNALCSWEASKTQVRHLFKRQAIPMLWDFAENNLFANAAGDFGVSLGSIVRVIERWSPHNMGFAYQADAQTQTISANKTISTDPPYYDNIGYADLSDFFYIWLRKSLRDVFPTLLSTIAVPKAEELVATPYRHGSKEKAENFFLTGMTQAMSSLSAQPHPAGPITIYYAFKQSDTETTGGTSSTGWETFLEAVNRAGLQLTGTWPMRTELSNRPIGTGTNSLASSIVLVCRKRPADAPSISRREFIRELNGVLPEALDEMTKGSGDERSPVAPVDLSQAIIGPGMAVFSKYAAVLEADGSPMSVRTALQLINRFLAEDDFDADTQFCLHWFEQHGWTESVFGEADVLARSKSTSVDAMKEAGVLQSGSGKVRLLKWAEYPTDWDPRTDKRMPVWEALHQLIRALKEGGESASGALLAALGGKAEAVRQLAYRLYTLCERLGKAEDARAYNELITSWTAIEAASVQQHQPTQGELRFDS